MAKTFEVWHINPKTKDERCEVYESLDVALEKIKQNWSNEDGEKFTIVERIGDFEIVNKDEEVDPCYGLEKFTMTVADLNALVNGKKLYATINADEYAIEIDYAGNDE